MKISSISNNQIYSSKLTHNNAAPSFGSKKRVSENPLLDLYIKDIKKNKPISRKREKELALKIKNGGEEALKARNELMAAHLSLVIDRAIRREKNSDMQLMDLIQEGNLGLYRATGSYNGLYAFSTYAVPWIDSYMKRAEYTKYFLIKLPTNAGMDIFSIKKAITELTQKFNRPPTISEISRQSKLSVRKILTYLKFTNKPLSINNIIDRDDKDSTEYEEIMHNKDSETPTEILDKKILEDYIKRCMEGLSEKTKQQLILSYGLFGSPQLSLKEIAEMYNVSYQAVQNHLKKAYAHIKKCCMADDKSREFVKN